MKTIIYIYLSIVPFFSMGQYNNIKFKNNKYPELTIKQIDQYDFSTIVHFTYSNISSLKFNGSEDLNIYENGLRKKLLNSYNLPLDEKVHIFNETGEHINFALEFEKLDSIGQDFQIISSSNKYFQFESIKIDTNIKTNFVDVESFISETPSREYYVYYHEGYPVLKYAYKGIILAIKLTSIREYGEYFQPQIMIQNYNRKDILIDPLKINAQYQIKDKYFNALVIDYKKYLKLVNKTQSKERFFTGLMDGLAAVGAGYSYISANSNTYMTASGRSLNYGFFGNNLYANSGTSMVNGSSSTKVNGMAFDGSKIFLASQIARQNMDNLKAQQVEKLNSLGTGYIKLNTIFPQSDYVCYCNIPYSYNAESVLMKIEINGNEFFFEWNKQQLDNLNFQ
ncbi:hypothetical protein [Sphingobacterium hungaricum]